MFNFGLNYDFVQAKENKNVNENGFGCVFFYEFNRLQEIGNNHNFFFFANLWLLWSDLPRLVDFLGFFCVTFFSASD